MFEFSFFTDIEELEDGACLQFTVWDKDRLSADDFIGETLCELKGKRFVYIAEFLMCLLKIMISKLGFVSLY